MKKQMIYNQKYREIKTILVSTWSNLCLEKGLWKTRNQSCWNTYWNREPTVSSQRTKAKFCLEFLLNTWWPAQSANCSRFWAFLICSLSASTIQAGRHSKKEAICAIWSRETNKSHKWWQKCHPNSHFAMATVNYLKDLAATMGPGAVYFLSQDDNSRIQIRSPAARKQSPFSVYN